MKIQDELIESIKINFNLNIYEIKIWTALLSRGIGAAGELSEISNVPRSRAYDILESLERKGFIIMKVGRPIKYIAVQPEEIIKRVKDNIKNDKEYKVNQINKLKETEMFTELNQLYNQGIKKTDASDLSGSITGRNNIYNFIKNSIDTAKDTIIIASGKEGLIRKFNVLKNNINKAVKRGVKLKVISNTNNIPSEVKKIDFKKVNYESRFVIIDDDLLINMLSKDDKKLHPNFDSAVTIKSPYFIKTIKKMIA